MRHKNYRKFEITPFFEGKYRRCRITVNRTQKVRKEHKEAQWSGLQLFERRFKKYFVWTGLNNRLSNRSIILAKMSRWRLKKVPFWHRFCFKNVKIARLTESWKTQWGSNNLPNCKLGCKRYKKKHYLIEKPHLEMLLWYL